jgi:hypothetical protein
MWLLTVGCDRPSKVAAFESLRVSTTATKLRNGSMPMSFEAVRSSLIARADFTLSIANCLFYMIWIKHKNY